MERDKRNVEKMKMFAHGSLRTITSSRTILSSYTTKGRLAFFLKQILCLLPLFIVVIGGCAKHNSPVNSEPVKEPTEEERMLGSTTWIADSMQVNGENAILFYNNYVRGNDTALVDYNYAGCTFSFLLNYKVWFRTVTTIPWLNYYYPEKALEDWSISKNDALSIQFPYSRPLQEAVWDFVERSRTSLVLTRTAGKDTITLYCSAGDTDADWTPRMNVALSKLLYKTWSLESVSNRQLALADSLKTITFSDFSGGAGFADVRYLDGSVSRNSARASMAASMLDDIPEFGIHVKYMPLPETASTYFNLVFLGEHRMELVEEGTKTRFIFRSGQ